MEATNVSIYFSGIGSKPYIGITLSNSRAHLETQCLCYADNILSLRKKSGYYGNSSWISKTEIIELLSGCFVEGSNFEREMEKFFRGRPYEMVNGFVMNIYGEPVLVKRPKKQYFTNIREL